MEIKTTAPQQMLDITDLVRQKVQSQGLKDGLVSVFVPHTTAGITINENADPDVVHDILSTLERTFPTTGPYRHFEGNSHAHIKASLMGASVTIPVKSGRLSLGTWQGIYLCEFDGPRTRRVEIQLLGV